MNYRFSLSYLSTLDVSPPKAVSIAAEVGYDHLGIRLLPASIEGPYPLLTDKALLRETKAAMRDTGVTLADIELIRVGPNFQTKETKQFLDRGAELGAMNVLVAGDDPDFVRCSENFAELCEITAQYNMTADLEFMPWTMVPDLMAAKKIIDAVGCDNAGILIDAIHFQRSNTTLAQIASLDPSLINYAQLCDAPSIANPTSEQLIFTARQERLYPGEGDIDFKAFLGALPTDIVLSLEVPHLERAKTRSALQRAQEVMSAAKSFITNTE